MYIIQKCNGAYLCAHRVRKNTYRVLEFISTQKHPERRARDAMLPEVE
jgi:hypothetical protein